MSRVKRSLPFLLAFVAPVLSGLAIVLQSWWLVLPPLFLFVATPLMDQLFGDATAELEDNAAAAKWRDWRYDIWLYLWVPAQLVLQALALRAAQTADPSTFVGLVFAAGLLGGLGINVGHELMHRKGRAERALAEVLLTSTSYAHFCVEHVLGHHKHVATEQDGSSARFGEPLPRFLLRSIAQGLVSAWRLEGKRVEKLGIPLGVRDRRVRYPLAWLALCVVIGLGIGPLALVAFWAQCAVAIGLLESINYLEHYGLSRAQLPDGSYERVTPHHSWSSAHRLTSLYLFNLTRHADHHANASRPFFALRHVEEGPKLPYGYATMLVLAFVPPLWRHVVDPLLVKAPLPPAMTPARSDR